MMYEQEKSDSLIVAMKLANKPVNAGAEPVEPREEAKGNTEKLRMRRTQSRESVLQRLDRVRQEARRGSGSPHCCTIKYHATNKARNPHFIYYRFRST
jgi:hypothetical protein